MGFSLGALTPIMWLGCLVGGLGIVMMSITYPIYKAILKRRKKKYSAEILDKSNQILNESQTKN